MRTILRRARVEKATGLSRSSIYEGIAKGTFPKPVKIGEKAVGWIEEEIEAWQAERIAERDKAKVGSESPSKSKTVNMSEAV